MNESSLWLGHRMSLANYNIYMQWFRVNTNQIHRYNYTKIVYKFAPRGC